MLPWLALSVLLPGGWLCAADDAVAVVAQVFNGYQRTRLPDKSFKPEAYVFGEGGCWTRPVQDPSMEAMTFLRVAQAVAAPLRRLNYYPARTAAEVELMILVYWGSTEGSRESRPNTLDLDSPDRYMLDERNARILGYTEALERAYCAPHMPFAQDTLVEIGENRYFVVLQAYDAKTAVREKMLKPLWTARLSMRERGNNFDAALGWMLRDGSRYFGQDSNGLHRRVDPETRVDLGPLEVIETVPEK